MNHNEKQKIDTLYELITTHGVEGPSKGRPVAAFITNPITGAYHHATRDAYALRFIHCKILMAIDQGMPCINPANEVPNTSARRTLWLYMHYCLPEYLGKQAELRSLLDLHNANKLMQGIEQIILRKLAAGEITDAAYASAVRDDTNFFSFANAWFDRPIGSRAKSKKLTA
jgi:hypothetical protein